MTTATLPAFDELDNIRTTIQTELLGEIAKDRKFDRQRCEDIIFELLTMSYVYGIEVAGLDLEQDIPVDREKMRQAVMAKTAGENFLERMNGHIDAADQKAADSDQISANLTTAETLANELAVLAETEAHRVMNTAVADGAEEYLEQNPSQNLTKTWLTRRDDRVRETHDYLEGMTVPYDARFYTFDGDSARFPGDFTDAANNVGCRCLLRLNEE